MPTRTTPYEYHDLRLQVDKPSTTVRTSFGYYANIQR
jgi:hypothetical protein